MRLCSLSATALAATSLLHPFVLASPHPQATTPSISEVITSATTTYTLTRTVERVVQTEYATLSSGSSSGEVTATGTTTLLLSPLPVTTGTSLTMAGVASAVGSSTSAAGSSSTASQSAQPSMSVSGVGSRYAVEYAGVAAWAGLVGMLFA